MLYAKKKTVIWGTMGDLKILISFNLMFKNSKNIKLSYVDAFTISNFTLLIHISLPSHMGALLVFSESWLLCLSG